MMWRFKLSLKSTPDLLRSMSLIANQYELFINKTNKEFNQFV